MSYNLLHPILPVPTSSSHVGACLSTLSFFAARLDWLQPQSILQLNTLMLCCPCLLIDPPDLSQKDFFTSCGQATLMSTATCPSNGKMSQHGHLMPKPRVSHMTAPGGPLTRHHVGTSKICFLHGFICSLPTCSQPDRVRRSKCGHCGRALLNVQIIHLHEES